MKKVVILSFFAAVILMQSCSDVRRNPGTIYMPDMAYSRAFETYAERDSMRFTTDTLEAGGKIFYNNLPVAGTVARGEEMPFLVAKDAQGDTANYVAAKLIPNPLPPLDSLDMKESERLFLVNCAICHGVALNGNGPLYKDGNGPFPAKPAALVGDAKYAAMPDGQMYYSIMYGKNLMGSYASQLSRKQRWMIIHYIKSKQAEAAASASPAKDSTATTKK